MVLALASMLASTMTTQAEEVKFRFIDYVNVEQEVNLDTCDVYVVPLSLAEVNPKKKKSIDKQKAAFEELGETVVKVLKSSYKKATYHVVADVKDAPAGALIVEATLKDIDWGAASMSDIVWGGGKAEVSGSYNVRLSNAHGVVLEFDNRRRHNTSLNDNAVGIIRTYNKVMVEDLIDIMKKVYK